MRKEAPVERRHQRWTRLEDDGDPEITAELHLLGSLVSGPASVLFEDEPLAWAIEILLEERVPAVVVVDAQRNLRGLVTRADVIRLVARTPDAVVADAMSSVVLTLPSDAPPEAAAALMAAAGVGQVAVSGRSGELVGMVSAIDLARYIAVRAGCLAA